MGLRSPRRSRRQDKPSCPLVATPTHSGRGFNSRRLHSYHLLRNLAYAGQMCTGRLRRSPKIWPQKAASATPPRSQNVRRSAYVRTWKPRSRRRSSFGSRPSAVGIAAGDRAPATQTVKTRRELRPSPAVPLPVPRSSPRAHEHGGGPCSGLFVVTTGAGLPGALLLVVAVMLCLRARHWLSLAERRAPALARRTRCGAAWRRFRKTDGGCVIACAGRAAATSTRWRSRRPESGSRSIRRPECTMSASSAVCSSRPRGSVVAVGGGGAEGRFLSCAWFARLVWSGTSAVGFPVPMRALQSGGTAGVVWLGSETAEKVGLRQRRDGFCLRRRRQLDDCLR